MKLDDCVTVFEHVPEDGKVFLVTAAEPWSVTMIHRLKKQRPEDVEIKHVNKDGSLVAELPFSWMRIIPKKEVTEEMRENGRRNAATNEAFRPRVLAVENDPNSREMCLEVV